MYSWFPMVHTSNHKSPLLLNKHKVIALYMHVNYMHVNVKQIYNVLTIILGVIFEGVQVFSILFL